MKDQLSPAGGGVYILGQTFKANLSIVKLCDGLNEMLQRSPKSIQLPDNQAIPFPYIFKRFCQSWSLSCCSTDRIGKDLAASYFFKGIFLQVKRLILG